MKWFFTILMVGFAAASLITGCKNEIPKTAEKAKENPPVETRPHPQTGGFSGKVVETMDASRYTYVQVDTGEKKIWLAAPQLQVKTGDFVKVSEGQPMLNFHSKTLNRDFALIYFVSGVTVTGERQKIAGEVKLPPGHPITVNAKDARVDLCGIHKAKGGQTIAEIYSDKEKFGGKQIKVRGKVVKFYAQIMGKNWVHIRDSSSYDENKDLTVTTDAVVKMGDTILVSGTLAINKEFGQGVKCEAIIENAQVIMEDNSSK